MAGKGKNKKEKYGNCAGCNKPIKKIKRYYRDGKYFCAKPCRKAFIDKSKQKKEE